MDQKIGNKFFFDMLEKFKYPNDETKWRFLRREIFEIISSKSQDSLRGQKSFLVSILDEIKQELKEDAEKQILRECSETYRELIETGYFKCQTENRQASQSRRAIEEDIIPQRERLNVMGAIFHQIDNRNYATTIAVVDQYGELVAHKDFLFLLPPKKRIQRDGEPTQVRPGEIEEQRKHDEDRRQFQEILREHTVDLIVVCADCLEAKRLKKALTEFANLNSQQDQMQDEDVRDLGDRQEAFVIWGRPEIPKLFATSHQSNKLLKAHPFILKKAICLARFEQDPMNEILNLWSPIMSENMALQLSLHPL